MSDPEFDIVIVGGGTAGCVLASRFSALPHLQILLLEAGANRNDDPKVQTPLTSRQMFGKLDYDWTFETEPQGHLNDRIIHQTRGRMLGGSSALNSHSLVYPNQDMHDTWAEIINDRKWGWEQMKECYSRFCDDPKTSEPSADAKGVPDTDISKPIKSSYPQQLNELQEAWEAAFTDLGLRSGSDGVSGQCFGGFTTTNAIDDRPGKGERSHAGNAYLQPILHRKNLVVQTNACTTRILFQKSQDFTGLTAIGVEYEKDGKIIFAAAKQEVIISAGAFGSPQLLELSGIGEKGILQHAGIECLIDLVGVGENLQDHLNFGPSVEICSNIETLDAAARDPMLMAEYQRQYSESRTGPFAEGAAYSFAFWPLQIYNTRLEEKELRSLLDLHSSTDQNTSRAKHHDFIKRMILSHDEASATVFMTRRQRYTDRGSEVDGNYMTVIAMLSHPFSLGSTHVKSAEPGTQPRIDCGYMSHPLDLEVLSRHCLQIEHLLEEPAYRNIIKVGGKRLPVEHSQPFKTPADVKPAIRQYGATNYHPCGTCAMMPPDDGGVVDSNLRVYGTGNLRVCDASIFPIIPRGNILTTVYAVAEKAAEIVLKDHSNYLPSTCTRNVGVSLVAAKPGHTSERKSLS